MATKSGTMSVEDVVELLELCETEKDWGDVCQMVKDDNGGEYPDFWRKEIMLSGVATRVRARWPAF